MPMTSASLRQGISSILSTLETRHQDLSALDAKVGDGDLGITLLKAFREMDMIKADLPDDLGTAFMQCAGAVTKVSSSSFGNLMATALMSAAKSTKGAPAFDWQQMSGLLAGACDAMAQRGRGHLGDKTVLDPISATAAATTDLSDPDAILLVARAATIETLDAFRERPNKIGRARIFGDKTIGLDDPGMVAFLVMLEALIAGSTGAGNPPVQ